MMKGAPITMGELLTAMSSCRVTMPHRHSPSRKAQTSPEAKRKQKEDVEDGDFTTMYGAYTI